MIMREEEKGVEDLSHTGNHGVKRRHGDIHRDTSVSTWLFGTSWYRPFTRAYWPSVHTGCPRTQSRLVSMVRCLACTEAVWTLTLSSGPTPVLL